MSLALAPPAALPTFPTLSALEKRGTQSQKKLQECMQSVTFVSFSACPRPSSRLCLSLYYSAPSAEILKISRSTHAAQKENSPLLFFPGTVFLFPPQPPAPRFSLYYFSAFSNTQVF